MKGNAIALAVSALFLAACATSPHVSGTTRTTVLVETSTTPIGTSAPTDGISGDGTDRERRGLSVEVQMSADATPEAIDDALAIIGRRFTGMGEGITVEFVRNDDGRVTMLVTGFTDAERAISLISARGGVSFRPVLESYPTSPMIGTDTPNINPDTGLSIVDDPSKESWLNYESVFGQEVLKVGPARLEGTEIEAALPHFAEQLALWVVELAMSPGGADKFAEMTGEAAAYPVGDPRRQIAIVLDGVVVSSPAVSPDVPPDVGIVGGSAQIAIGDVENAQDVAEDLASVIGNGSLPTTVEVVVVTPLE